MKKTIGVFAHVDGGKTTFSESLLYNTNTIRNKGRVDHKDTFLDSHSVEKERGITVFSDIGIFNYKDNKYFLVDTPGHVDFSPEMERAISVLDYAILIVSAVELVQGHTETIWELLKKYNVPTFIFINKIDRVGANIEEAIKDIQMKLTKDGLYIENSIKELKEDYIEFIAERDETLLEEYLNGELEEDKIIDAIKKEIKERKEGWQTNE